MEWCRDFKFQMIRLEWERIFLHFEIESNYPGPEQPKFVWQDSGARSSIKSRS